jgi:hypothetical protein
VTEDVPWKKLLGDPLREVTRKERRALLAVSIPALIVAKTGILPGKIESIGIEFPVTGKPALLLIFAGVVAYFLLVFIIYAVSDFIVWQRSYHELIDRLAFENAERQYKAEQAGATNVVIGIEAVDTRREAWKSTLRKAIGPTSVARALVEFLLPIVIGLFALVSLLLGAAQ